ncbi:MAG: carboxypeptidase regulatory-like domain-containing protein [Deltaproteobacteria bacterium]|nr:carboxypeptidase regulatory-like domain-containing protein [Deltaproteobacteria bacterium]
MLEPPRPLRPAVVPYPAGAPPHSRPVVVKVTISVGVDGRVEAVVLATRSLPIFDDAVVRAARAFRFAPGRYGGQPVRVQIAFTHTFLPPPRPSGGVVPAGLAPTSLLRGRLVELGTRAPVSGATVVAEVGGRRYVAEADPSGRFRLSIPAGAITVRVHSSGYRPFLQRERVAERQQIAVTYFVERERYDPYEIVVVSERRREEVSRIALTGPELTQVPGTFGDPFRVIQTLPGTASVISLVPFPVVRGASPSSTGTLLDGARVPLLYHLLAGPSVVHPEFIDEVRFFPGGAPVIYGGYTGGIVDGQTRRARPDERRIDVDLNLMAVGGLVRWPIPKLGLNVTAAGRYGYPGLILSLATKQASLSYWDYQLRVDGGTLRNGWTVFAYGARDELDTVSPSADPADPDPPLEPALILNFHRLDLRAQHGRGRFDGAYRLLLGYDHSEGQGGNVTTWVVDPRARWTFRPGPRLTLVGGLEGALHFFSQAAPPASTLGNFSLAALTQDLTRLYDVGALAEVLWRPSPRWLFRPGLRGDLLHDGATRQLSADPRLTVRYLLARRSLPDVPADSDRNGIWLKGSVGLYHQPPRFVLPLPGLDTMPLRFGLLRSIQGSLGLEVPFAQGLSLGLEGYFSLLDPTIFDLAFNPESLTTAPNTSLLPTTTEPSPNRSQKAVDELVKPLLGRAYGLELLIRRQSRTGIYGWLSYTLSRSERRRDPGWAPYDFDRTHLLNLVVGIPLPRSWDLGLRLQYQSGKPATSTAGYNAARQDGYLRIDLRIDKRAAWRGWLLDFYIDLLNVALLPEELLQGETLRYVIPTVGVRGRF